MGVNGVLLGPYNTHPGSLKPDSREPETETGKLETEKRVHGIHDPLETGLQSVPRSLVAPLNRGRRIEELLLLQWYTIKSFKKGRKWSWF